MAESSAEVRRVIESFCRELERMGIACERVLLFGSHRLGTATEGSDIDLVVVSRSFGHYNDRERLESLGIAAARILEPVQARGVTPEEVASHALSPFLERVLQEQAVVVG